MRYSIDINESAVRIIAFTAKGIRRVGYADFDCHQPPAGAEYVQALTSSIKIAAKAAGVPLGYGHPCTVVAGGPQVVVRRFRWPQMPVSALMGNTVAELSPLLPGEAHEFSIGFEVLKRSTNEEFGTIVMDVLAAALPLDFVDAVKFSLKKAGFKPLRIDVRENSRINWKQTSALRPVPPRGSRGPIKPSQPPPMPPWATVRRG